jgi:sugar lactone lactonase YvrE
VADTGNNRVQLFSSTGEYLRSWTGGVGSGSAFAAPVDVAVDSDGKLYVLELLGHRVQIFSSTGAFEKVWTSGQLRFPNGIAIGNNGLVYVADTGNNRIQVFERTGVLSDSIALASSGLNGPLDVALDAGNDIYVADQSNRVQVFDQQGQPGAGWGQIGGGEQEFFGIGGLTVANEQVYVSDSGNGNVKVFTTGGPFEDSWGNDGPSAGPMDGPTAVATNSSLVYMADTNNHRVLVFDRQGVLVDSIGTGSRGFSDLRSPQGVSLDQGGRVYIADTFNARIKVYDSIYQPVDEWPIEGAGFGTFNYPTALAVSPLGLVYVAVPHANEIQVFSTSGEFQYRLPRSGNESLSAPDGVAVDAVGLVYVADTENGRIRLYDQDGTPQGSIGYGKLSEPRGLAVDSAGRIFVADSGDNRIKVFLRGGRLEASWGSLGSAEGQFREPHAVAVDAAGTLYVADTGNHRGQVLRPPLPEAGRPIATFVKIEPVTVRRGQPVALYGLGGDGDATPQITAYEWTISEHETPFATTMQTQLDTATLEPGRYTLSLRVRDDEGEWSEPAQRNIDVLDGSVPDVKIATYMLFLDADTEMPGGGGGLATWLGRESGAIWRLEQSAKYSPYPHVNIVALYDGPRSNDTWLFTLPAGTQSLIATPQAEANMGDPEQLVAFVQAAQGRWPGDYFYLAIADHANALDGIAWDYTSEADGSERLTNAELLQAMQEISDSQAHPIDVLHLDGCLLGLIESAYQLQGTAHYLIASENLAWSAFGYAEYARRIQASTNPHDFATNIVDEYERLVNADNRPYTIAAYDLGRVDTVVLQLDRLATKLQSLALQNPAIRAQLTSLRKETQALDSDGSIQLTALDEYIDLYDWAERVEAAIDDQVVRDSAKQLRDAIDALFVDRPRIKSGVYQGTTVDLSKAHGIAIYYPQQASARLTQAYIQGDLRFTVNIGWDEFLAAMLDGARFDLSNTARPIPIAPLPITLDFESTSVRVYLPITKH